MTKKNKKYSFSEEDIEKFKIRGYGSYDWLKDDIEDEREQHRLVQTIERIVRGSLEGKSYREYLKENMRFDHCSILSGIPPDKLKKIEIHHHPFCLYDLCKITLMSAGKWNHRVSTLLIAERVIEDHFRNEVGLVPLAETVHEMVHAGQVFIDPRCIFGNWTAWVERHADCLVKDIEMVARVRARLNWSNENEAENIRRLEISPKDWSTAGGATKLEELLKSKQSNKVEEKHDFRK